MPRIRTIKPEFFNSYDVVNLTPLSRLFYAYLWTESDRDGFLEWKPKNFRMRFFPTDNYEIDDLTGELLNNGMIVLHDLGDEIICEIPCFVKHQSINNRESEGVLAPRVKVACTHGKAEGRKEGKERKGTRVKVTLPSDLKISDRVRRWASEKGHSNLEAHFDHFVSACNAKGYKYANWDDAFMNAIRKNWAGLDNTPTHVDPMKALGIEEI